MKNNNKQSSTLYTVRAFALISIVMAHSAYAGIENEFIVALFQRFSTVGVFTFMVLAGYHFNKDKYTGIGVWLKQKTKTLLVPWLVLGLVAYSTKFIVEGGFFFDPMGVVNYILGNGSLYYYMTMLVLCQIIMIYLPKNIFVVILGVVSVALTASGVLPDTVDNTRLVFTYLNPYLNVFNWLGIFVFGMYLREYDVINRLFSLKTVYKLLILAGVAVLFILSPLFDKINQSGYFTHFALLLEGAMFVAVLIISDFCTNAFLADIGQKTMPVYMLHLLVIGKLSMAKDSVIFAIIRPCLCILIFYAIIHIGLFVSKKIRLESLYKTILGIR